ncbi:MAG: hypothetical protein LKJ47_05825 [Bifidobacteriaceae bacterium]|nr:hypothetical protein [Bifidobacteriaceae bacterium]
MATAVIAVVLPHNSVPLYWIALCVLIVSELLFFGTMALLAARGYQLENALPAYAAMGGFAIAQVVLLIVANQNLWQAYVIAEVVCVVIAGVIVVMSGVLNEKNTAEQERKAAMSNEERLTPKTGSF